MIKGSEFIDISLIKIQNELAFHIANLLSVDELEEIMRQCTIDKDYKRKVNSSQTILFNIEFEDKSIIIFDILDINKFPTNRYIHIKFKFGNSIQYNIKCKNYKKAVIYFKEIIARAINFLKYRNKEDRAIIKTNIINNFSKDVVKGSDTFE